MGKRIEKPFFVEKGNSTTFRVIDAHKMIEEVSGSGEAKFEGLSLRTVWTATIFIGKAKKDKFVSKAILAAKNGETASYISHGTLSLGSSYTQKGSGTVVFYSHSPKRRLAKMDRVRGKF